MDWESPKSKEKREAPFTHWWPAEWISWRLDYADMVVLSGMFRRWALYDPDVKPEQATGYIQMSADMERTANWVGKGWMATNPSEDPNILVFLADLERRHSRTIKLDAYRGTRYAYRGS